MGEYGGIQCQTPDLRAATLYAALTDADRLENQAAATRVLAASDWAEHLTTGPRPRGRDRDWMTRYAASEVAAALSCSARIAQNYIGIGTALRYRLPLVRAAFQAGDIDYRRVEAIWRATTNTPQNLLTAIEPQIVSAARTLPPGKLGTEIERLIITTDPAFAAARRRCHHSERHVNRHGFSAAPV
ncbi:DUF222 domain-containing protein [Skermania sp. ID1734]|uniref:DUF222 domain-containing protein n=1 Tax=Skermania sp. ID1734 TaxID=2597516 RepID=UPI00118077E7|nr:DUF222 domain-containing protein [Skermania sp. ID1734]TSE02200.1 DUF222 domain-containing protein [Skermania sp. ID1734]